MSRPSDGGRRDLARAGRARRLADHLLPPALGSRRVWLVGGQPNKFGAHHKNGRAVPLTPTMTLSTRSSGGSASLRPSTPLRRSPTLTIASLLALATAISAVACGSSTSGAGHTPGGTAAEAGQGADGSLGVGGSASGSTGNRGGTSSGGSGNAASSDGGSSATNGASGANDTSGGSTSTGGTDAIAGSGTVAGSAGSATLGTTQCSDGIDNDGDGLIDGLDPECTGPFDNDEGSFATGIPGDNKDPKWQDCFFDGNSGAGDDGCRYATDCLYGTMAQDDPSCTLSQQCLDFCGALTPNGCDCFGCCTVQAADGSSVDIYEVSSCSIAQLDDEKACPRCTKNTQCQNTCGECELCPGKTVADLPASCTPPTTGTGGASGTGGSSDTGGTSGTGGTGGTSGTGGSSDTGGTGGAPPPPPTYTCDGGA